MAEAELYECVLLHSHMDRKRQGSVNQLEQRLHGFIVLGRRERCRADLLLKYLLHLGPVRFDGRFRFQFQTRLSRSAGGVQFSFPIYGSSSPRSAFFPGPQSGPAFARIQPLQSIGGGICQFFDIKTLDQVRCRCRIADPG